MGPSLIQIEHARVLDAERHDSAARPAHSGPADATLRAVVAVALVAFAFAVIASSASARSIDAVGASKAIARQLASSTRPAPAPPSDGTSPATVASLIAGTVVVVIAGALLVDAVGKRAVPRSSRPAR